MSRGRTFPDESAVEVDPRTGARVRRVTGHASIHHHPFFLAPAHDDRMQRMVFVSHRTGRPEVFAEDRAAGQLVQLTDRPDLDEWSVHPSHDGRAVFYTAAGHGFRLDLDAGTEELLVRFPDPGPRPPGGVMGDMGTTAVSRDDRYWAVQYRDGAEKVLVVVDTRTGDRTEAARGPAIGHIQFCPDGPHWLTYAGPNTDRLRLVRRDGTGHRSLIRQGPMQWVTHEIWIPGRFELAFVDWPHGVRAVDPTTGAVRAVADFNAWHVAFDRTGRWLIGDTNIPDVGIQLMDTTTGRQVTVCHPAASNAGDHWAGPFPYAHGPVAVYAPQHTHPHPVFAPDGRTAVFTSDRTGHAQVYEVDLAPFYDHLHQPDAAR